VRATSRGLLWRGLDIYLCVGLPAIAILSEAVPNGLTDFGARSLVDGAGYQADGCRQANLLHRQRLPSTQAKCRFCQPANLQIAIGLGLAAIS
jgi:hypothetical protein